MEKVGRKVKNITDTVCTGKSNMKKTALALILVSTFSHAEQFVVIYRTFFGPGDHVSADKLHSYAFSTQPLKENEKILTVNTDGSLLEDAIVMKNIDFATFVKEISSDGISLDACCGLINKDT